MRSLVTAYGMDDNDALVNQIVLQHEAQTFGIEPTADEIKDAEMKLPVFQGAGGEFDPTKYAAFVDDKLTPRGFTDTQLDDLIRLSLQFGKLSEIIEAAVVLTPAEVRLAYEQRFSKTDASVIRLKTATLPPPPARRRRKRSRSIMMTRRTASSSRSAARSNT